MVLAVKLKFTPPDTDINAAEMLIGLETVILGVIELRETLFETLGNVDHGKIGEVCCVNILMKAWLSAGVLYTVSNAGG